METTFPSSLEMEWPLVRGLNGKSKKRTLPNQAQNQHGEQSHTFLNPNTTQMHPLVNCDA